MSTLNLSRPPALLPPIGVAAWTAGTAAEPCEGDLWLLSLDGEALGLFVLSRVHATFVHGWPVTLPDDPAFSPAIIKDETPLGVGLTIWTGACTGLNNHLLHRRIGSLLSGVEVSALRSDMQMNLAGLHTPDKAYGDAESREFLSRLLSHYQQLCYLNWPTATPGEGVLDRDAIAVAGLDLLTIRDKLEVSLAEALALADGAVIPTVDQLEQIFSDDVELTSLLTEISGPEVAELIHPLVKFDLLAIGSDRGVSENAARNIAWRELQLAARSTVPHHSATRQKVRDALDRLIAREDHPA